MLAIKHILFPLDFSDRCSSAAPFVEAMASRFGAKVTLISAVQPFFSVGIGDPGGPTMINADAMMDELKVTLGGALVKEFAHLQVERVAEFGEPAQVITNFAHSSAVDLIMMPTHSYGPFRKLLLGSVTAKVLHDAKCPVWTAAHVEEDPSHDQVKPHSILCAVDATSKSILLMKWASEFSQSTGATLKLVHVIPGMEDWPSRQLGMEGWPSRPLDRKFEEDMRKKARQQIAKLQASAGVEAPLCVEAGGIADGVCEEARRQVADLVVIGRGVLQETLGRLRTHAHAIIRQAPCPVLSV